MAHVVLSRLVLVGAHGKNQRVLDKDSEKGNCSSGVEDFAPFLEAKGTYNPPL